MEKIDRTVIEALLRQIKRPGINDLIDYLQGGTDFYSAPASTRFHGAEPGGLVRHSMEVYRQLNDIMQMYQDVLDDPIDHDTTLICGLLHDVCKANFYKAGTRNVKNEQTGQAWHDGSRRAPRRAQKRIQIHHCGLENHAHRFRL